MTLLSGMALAAHPAVVASAAKTSLPNPLELSGSVHGTFKLKGVSGGSVNASGNLRPIGKVTVAGKVAILSANTGTETLTISTSKGKVLLSTVVMATGTSSFTGTYTINGGTKAFAGETGSGTIVVSLTATKFSSTFSPAPTPIATPLAVDMNK